MCRLNMIAVAAVTMAAKLGPILCSAPTEAATTDFALQIYNKSSEVVEHWKTDRNKDGSLPTQCRLAVIRGYNPELELLAFKALLRDPSLGSKAVPADRLQGEKWTLNLSLAFWLLLAIGSTAVREIHADESAAIWEMRRDNSIQLQRLRQVANGSITWDELGAAGLPDDAQIGRWLSHLIKNADVLCILPAASHDIAYYRQWKQGRARGVAIHDASAMNRADFYCVWGNTLLPCFLGGDISNMGAEVMSCDDQDMDGNFHNRLGVCAQYSALFTFVAMGMPVYRFDSHGDKKRPWTAVAGAGEVVTDAGAGLGWTKKVA